MICRPSTPLRVTTVLRLLRHGEQHDGLHIKSTDKKGDENSPPLKKNQKLNFKLLQLLTYAYEYSHLNEFYVNE